LLNNHLAMLKINKMHHQNTKLNQEKNMNQLKIHKQMMMFH